MLATKADEDETGLIYKHRTGKMGFKMNGCKLFSHQSYCKSVDEYQEHQRLFEKIVETGRFPNGGGEKLEKINWKKQP